MTSRERVLAALRREEPDRVPYCELGIDRSLAQQFMGWGKPESQKANLEANSFLATSRSGVMTQTWIAVCVYLLLVVHAVNSVTLLLPVRQRPEYGWPASSI